MTKRRFIGLGRKSRADKAKKEPYELPDNFILGNTNQHREKPAKKGIKKVNSEDWINLIYENITIKIPIHRKKQ